MGFKIKKRRKKEFGFTIAELLVVVAIIGILSTVAIVNITVARAKARDAIRINELAQLVKGLEMYYIFNGDVYPCGDNHDNDSANDLVAYGGLGTEDSSGSGGGCDDSHADEPGFLNGYGATGTPNIECDTSDGKPQGGLFSMGITRTSCPKDPVNEDVNGIRMRYWYHASYDRKIYIIATYLETGLTASANDGGLCADVYEVGNGVGILRPNPNLGPVGCL